MEMKRVHGSARSANGALGTPEPTRGFIRVYPCLSVDKLFVSVFLVLAGCAIGPNYKGPDAPQAASFKENGDWVLAQPADAVPKGHWWEVFNDPILDGLVDEANKGNFTLAGAEARYRQTYASIAAARAQLFPTLGVNAGATRSGGGSSGSVAVDSSGNAVAGGKATRYNISLDAGWEPDLWGRVRRQVEAARANAEASQADLEAARLSLDAQLATAYFQLRATDAAIVLIEDTVKAFETNYQLTKNRYAAGVAGRVDVVQAESQLRSTQADALDLRATRAQLEHAVAVLVGKPPGEFAIVPVKLDFHMPSIPPGLPSTLLQRRPDIAAAERRVAAANAEIGVAQAAYFPSITLNASLGRSTTSLAKLFSVSNPTWSLGVGLAETLLDFGARRSQVEQARAAYDATVADYRQVVLTSMQDVEDNLAAMHWLAEESKVQAEATQAARESVALTVNQYKAGTVSFLNVALVQATQLNAERSLVTLLSRRLAATVALIKALGGTWEAPAAPAAAPMPPTSSPTPPPPAAH
jgi:NodT family efflux transporter outer membrane factor (OMF) lipoprotein